MKINPQPTKSISPTLISQAAAQLVKVEERKKETKDKDKRLIKIA